MHAPQTAGPPAGYQWHQPAGWWLKNSHYVLYMIRELTAVFAVLWVLAFLQTLPLLKADPTGRAWRQVIESPGWLIFSVICLVFVLYHAWTAFTATSTLMYFRFGKTPIPGAVLNGMMFLQFFGATIVIGLILVYVTLLS